MRIVVAPDSFKGSLSAFAAADAIARGVRNADPSAQVDACPLSDGGEGFLDVLLSAVGGTLHDETVTGPEGDPLVTRWAMLSGGRTAVVETAAVVGPGCRTGKKTSPSLLTTYGIGELILRAVGAGARQIVVGLGGSTTTDGGTGMAQALGVRFAGASSPLTGNRLGGLLGVDRNGRDPRLETVDIVGAFDVDNPLTGPEGAAQVYGPQKGASEAEVAMLDAGLKHLAKLAGDAGTLAGDGAAGGLGYGLRVFGGARLTSGVEYVLDAAGFGARLEGCHLVLTGEGRLDGQSARGKVVAGVSRRCRDRGVPVVALAGAIARGAAAARAHGLTAFFSLCDGPRTEIDALQKAAELLAALTENVVRLRNAPAAPCDR
jgi:glycerate kinase